MYTPLLNNNHEDKGASRISQAEVAYLSSETYIQAYCAYQTVLGSLRIISTRW